MSSTAPKPKKAAVDELLASLADLGRRALSDDAHIVMAAAADLVCASVAVEFCSIWERLPDHSLLLRAGVGWQEGRVGQHVERNSSTPAARAILSQEPVVIDDLRRDRRFQEPSLLHDHAIAASLHAPIYGPSRPYGVVGAHARRRRTFRPVDVKSLQLIANALSTMFVCRGHEYQERHRHLMRAEQMMALGQVAAGLAHELRNPLTSIKGLIQVNRKEIESRGLPSEDFQVIEQEIRRMERSLQTFLDFARPPRPERRTLELAPLIQRVAALVQGRAKKQNVSLDVLSPSEPVIVEADPDQLQQLLLNLLLNALDAMPHGGVICIELRSPSEHLVSIAVRDTGPGIAPHILPVVFDTFVSGKETGVGLGLPVSRRIAEDHGGELTAANLAEGGASFTLTLPVRDKQPPPEAPHEDR